MNAAVVEVYRGDQAERIMLKPGQLVLIDETYSLRLVDVVDGAP